MTKRLTALVCSLALIMAVHAAAFAAEGDPVRLRFITQAPGSSYYIYGTSIARMMEEYMPKGSEADIIGRGASNVNPTTLNDRRGDIALTNSCNVVWAYTGNEEMYGEYGKHENIRSLTGMISDNYSFALARKAYVEQTGNDTLDKVMFAKDMPRLAIKPPGSLVPQIFKAVFEIMGAPSIEEMNEKGKVMRGQPAQISEMMRDGRVDFYVENVPLKHAGFTELTLTNDMTFLPMSKKVIEKMTDYGLPPKTVPAGSWRGLDFDYESPTTGSLFIVHKDVPEYEVYMFIKMMMEHLDEFITENPSLAEWKPDQEDYNSTYFKTVPLHPGAAKYYRERGWLK